MTQGSDRWEKVRSQFNALPYPNKPLDATPKDRPDHLAVHNITTPYYLRYQQTTDLKGKKILDAGCGSGYKLLSLAIANPGVHVVGIDISQNSIDLARQRLDYHGISSAELYCMPIEALKNLEQRFDYINCDDVLYLLADPVEGLQAMKSVLQPHGIIRVNMHSSLQRAGFYRVQELFKLLGCLEGTPSAAEMVLTRQTMSTLHDWVFTKKQTWKSSFDTDDEKLLANYLLRGDTGITMKEFSAILKAAGLEFISMVNWRQWNLEGLFKSIEDLPISVALGLAEMSPEEQIHIFELLHPVYRLLDLYCGYPNQGKAGHLLEDWSKSQWEKALVNIHPQLRTDNFKKILEAGAGKLGMIPLDKLLNLDNRSFSIDTSIATCLYPLLEAPQLMPEIVQRWLKVRPLNPITLNPADPNEAFETIRNFLIELESAGYLMIELK